MPQKPNLAVPDFNRAIGALLKDKSKGGALKANWRDTVIKNIEMGSDQVTFVRRLKPQSVFTMQLLISSIAENGGKLEMIPQADGDIELVGKSIKVAHSAKIVICRFDGFFRKCKWFPKN